MTKLLLGMNSSERYVSGNLQVRAFGKNSYIGKLTLLRAKIVDLVNRRWCQKVFLCLATQ